MANYGGRGFDRRDELARAKGFRSFYDYRTAPKEVRDRANAAYEAAHPDYKRTGGRKQSAEAATSRTRKRRLVSLGGHRESIDSMRRRELWAFVQRAARAGVRRRGRAPVRVVLYAWLTFLCVDPEEGDEHVHTIALWPQYGYSASHAAAAIREYGGQTYDADTGEITGPPDVIGWLHDQALDGMGGGGAIAIGEGDSDGAIGPECELVRVQLIAETKAHGREVAA